MSRTRISFVESSEEYMMEEPIGHHSVLKKMSNHLMSMKELLMMKKASQIVMMLMRMKMKMVSLLLIIYRLQYMIIHHRNI